MVDWPRRLRVQFGGETVADTRDAILLRQHGFRTVFWFPGVHVRTDPNNRAEGPPDGVMDMAHERAGGRRLWRY